MSKKILALQCQYIQQNTEILASTYLDFEQWEKNEADAPDIAWHRDMGFLILIGLCSPQRQPKGRSELMDLIVSKLTVVHRNRRSCAFKLGEVLIVANRFGVMTFTSKSEEFGDKWASLNLVRCQREIHQCLNSRVDGRDGRDNLYNYAT